MFVGRIGRAHGIRGEVVVQADSDYPDRFRTGARFATADARYPALVIRTVRPSPRGGLIVGFEEIANRTDAEDLRGVELLIEPDERRNLEPGEYWPDELEGLEVRAEGRRVGTVQGVDVDAAQTRLIVETMQGTVEIPFVAPLVPTVDVDRGYVEVNPVEGLLSPSSADE